MKNPIKKLYNFFKELYFYEIPDTVKDFKTELADVLNKYVESKNEQFAFNASKTDEKELNRMKAFIMKHLLNSKQFVIYSIEDNQPPMIAIHKVPISDLGIIIPRIVEVTKTIHGQVHIMQQTERILNPSSSNTSTSGAPKLN